MTEQNHHRGYDTMVKDTGNSFQGAKYSISARGPSLTRQSKSVIAQPA